MCLLSDHLERWNPQGGPSVYLSQACMSRHAHLAVRWFYGAATMAGQPFFPRLLRGKPPLVHCLFKRPCAGRKTQQMLVLCHAVLTCNDHAQVEERGAVSQDLELYISKDHQEDGFTLIARSEVR